MDFNTKKIHGFCLRKITFLLLSFMFLASFIIMGRINQETAYAGGLRYVDEASPDSGVYYDPNATKDEVDEDIAKRYYAANPTGVTDTRTGIYASGGTSSSKEADGTSGEDPGWLEKQMIKLFKLPGNILLKMEESWGMSLDSIVFGRIVQPGTNFFQFELVTNNPYGMTGAHMYNIFRLICMMLVWCIFIGQITKALIFNNSSKAREEMKASFSKMLYITLGLYLMPYALDIMFYVRDVVLYLLHELSSSMSMTGVSGGTAGGIVSVFKTLADKSWIWAMIYTGSTVLSLYFAYVYVGVALGMTIYFLMFPLVCVMSYSDKNVLNNWLKNVLSAVLVPVIDSILLIIPVQVYNGVYELGKPILAGILALMICVGVIPTRRVVGQLLGLNMGGIGAMAGAAMGALALAHGARGLLRGGANAIGHFRSAKEAKDEASMYEELGKAEKEVGQNYANALAFGSGTNNPAFAFAQGLGDGGEFSGINTDGSDKNISGNSFASGGFSTGSGGLNGGFSKDSKMKNLFADAFVSPSLRASVNENKEALEAAKNMPDTDPNKVIAMDAARSQLSESNEALENMNTYKAVNTYNGASAEEAFANKRQEILEKRMNMDNYNSPMFEGMSYARKAELARKRARKELIKGVTSTAGMAVGTGYGFAASTFLSPSSTVYAMAAGSMAGGAIGNAAGSAINYASYNTTPGRMVSSGVTAGVAAARTGGAYTRHYMGNSPLVKTVREPFYAAADISKDMVSRADNYSAQMHMVRQDLKNTPDNSGPNSFNGLV